MSLEPNSNQVEHLGISALLQGMAHVPGAILTATEAFEVVVDHDDPAAAQADTRHSHRHKYG